jgi:hypothetical protein
MAKKTCTTPIIDPSSELRQKTMDASIPASKIEYSDNPPFYSAEGEQEQREYEVYTRMYPFFVGGPEMSDQELVAVLANRRYNLQSREKIQEWLSSFDSLFFEAEPSQGHEQSQDARLNGANNRGLSGFRMGNTDYVVTLKGYRNNEPEVISILSRDTAMANNTTTAYFYRRFSERMAQGQYFLPVSPLQVMRSLSKELPVSKPIVMNRRAMQRIGKDTSSITPYSLAELKNLYGEHYKYLFSSPYVITDTMSGKFAQRHIGKTCIFYSKKPTGTVSVDDLVQGMKQTVNEDALGVLFMDEDTLYHNVEEMAAKMTKNVAGQDVVILPRMNNETRLFVGPAVAEVLMNYFNDKQAVFAEQFPSEFSGMMDTIKDQKAYLNNSERQSFIASQMIDFILRLHTKRNQGGKYVQTLNEVDKVLSQFPNGIYISPGVIYNYTKDIPVALVDTVNEQYSSDLDEKLYFTNLAKDPIGIPALNIGLNESQVAELFEVTNPLPVIDKSNTEISNTVIENYKNYQPNALHLYRELDRLGITESELSAVLHKNLLPLVQQQPDLNLAVQQLMERNKC